MKDRIAQETKDGTVLTIHVQPKATRTECVGVYGEALKIRVAALPADGAANEELIRFLARTLSVPASSVSLASGATGRHKRILVKGVTPQLALSRLHPVHRA